MTYDLETLNQGVIEAGYFGPVTGLVRMGDCLIRTDDFCMLIARLACDEGRVRVATRDGGFTEGSWSPQANLVQIGQYQIECKTFGAFADYIMRGGLFGWDLERPAFRPDFVRRAMEYVQRRVGDQPESAYIRATQQTEFANLEDRLLSGYNPGAN